MTRKAKRVKKIDGLSQISIDLKPRRCDSDVYINQEMDVTKLMQYLNEKKKKNSEITFFHLIVSALGICFYNRNKLNRFVKDRHIYEHNDVIISFVAKASFDDKSEELMLLIPIDEDDTVDTVSKKINNKVNTLRNKTMDKKGANSAIDALGKMPNILRVPIIGILKFMDKKGILPLALINDNLYYSSLIVSNLGSINCGAIYHNINDFGTCSGLATIGKVTDKDGKKVCELGINLDERIADGYYFVKSIKLLQYIFDNPTLLDGKSSQKINMEEIR